MVTKLLDRISRSLDDDDDDSSTVGTLCPTWMIASASFVVSVGGIACVALSIAVGRRFSSDSDV